MTFKEAEREVHQLTEGKYHSITYNRTTFDDGGKVQTCRVYCDKYGGFNSNTFDAAINLLKKAMGVPLTCDDDIDIDDNVTYGEGTE